MAFSDFLRAHHFWWAKLKATPSRVWLLYILCDSASLRESDFFLEAATGFEPVNAVLRTAAQPLGHCRLEQVMSAE